MSKKWLIIGTVSFSVGLSLSLVINKDIKQAALTGLLSVPATVAGVSVTEYQRRQKLNDKISTQQRQLQGLVQKETDFNNSIALLFNRVESLKQQEESITAVIESLNVDHQRYLQLATRSQSELEAIQNKVYELSDRKSSLEPEVITLEIKLRQLQEQEIGLAKLLVNLSSSQKQIEANLESSRYSRQQLQEQKFDLEENINNLAKQKQTLAKQVDSIQDFLEKLQKQKYDLEDLITNIYNDKQTLEKQFEDSTDDGIEFDDSISLFDDSADDDFSLEASFCLDNSELDFFEHSAFEVVAEEAEFCFELDNDADDFRNAKYINHLWKNTILPYWNHKDRRAGYRFLGNVSIEPTESDRLISIVGKNLQKLDCITDNSLQQSFSALNKDWIKIITFALSEYAYYYSDEKFWSGFCDHIGIEHNQTLENTLRQVTEQGINLLGLVRTTGGYKYVSTLWLQSGVPKQNLGHFATLVQDIADEYGWWEISHSSALDIAKALWQCWESRYRQWGTIKNFLNLENSNEDLEPISGQLVKNIAIIARELEYKSLPPGTIENREAREELIGSSNLSYSFFIRDWSDLITVLTSRTGKSDLSLIKRRNQLPYLYLDIANTLNTLLILPEQSIWKNQWRNLRGTYCQIPEAGWEDDIPSHGNLEIPELEIDIKQATDKWTCQLQNHHRNQIYQWEHEGINSEFPCLVFDAISGEHIQINISEPKIIGIEKIILFTPKEIEIKFNNNLDDRSLLETNKTALSRNIEIIDNLVPSSIREWRGKEVRLIESEALITIQNIKISWKLREQEQPQLIGLRLKDRKIIYLNAPRLYYPPQNQNTSINYLIESIECKSIIAKESFVISANDKWSQIELSQWITESGNYQAEFWQQEKQWSYRFEVKQQYCISQHQGHRNLEIYDRHNIVLSIPTKYDNTEQFWAEVIKLSNLYPLEELTFKLKSDREQYIFHLQANSSGELTLSLASLYDYLPKCDHYGLDVNQSGSEFYTILQTDYFAVCKLTTEVILKNLPSKENSSNSQSVNNQEQKSNMENMETTNQVPTVPEQWCLVTARQWKRESFLKYLNNDIERKQLQNLILDIIALEESVYDNMVLLRISNYSEARTHLQQIDHFQGIQRLKSNEVSRMINK
jgi:predicted  nucleic acid-binding Zn-ribbon protein